MTDKKDKKETKWIKGESYPSTRLIKPLICPVCNKETIETNSKYCPFCGTFLGEIDYE